MRRVCSACKDAKEESTSVVRDIGPNELLCPITHKVMVDPVMTSDGHTYERAAIEDVFEGTHQGDDV